MVVNDFWADNPDPKVADWVAEYKKRAKTRPATRRAHVRQPRHHAKPASRRAGVTDKPDDLATDRERMRTASPR